jgi:hypothetical protein
MEKCIGELKYAIHEVTNLCAQTKKDFEKKKENFLFQLDENITGSVKKEHKEVMNRIKAVKEIDNKYTEDCNKSVVMLTREIDVIKKATEEINLKMTKYELDFGIRHLLPETNI